MAKQQPIPKAARVTTDMVHFNAGNAKAALAEAGATNGKLHMIPLDKFKIAPGFNLRVTDSAAYVAKVDEIKQSILKNGFYVTKPLAAYVGKDESGADVIFLIDGHRRLEAAKAANAEGAEVTSVPCVLKPADSSDVDLTVALLKENANGENSMAETAVGVKRLLKAGLTTDEISDRLGFSKKYVSDLILLIGASRVIRDLVKRDKISGNEAVAQMRKWNKSDSEEYIDADGVKRKGKAGRADGKAEAAILKMVKNAEERGAARASRQDSDEGTRVAGKKTTAEGETEAPEAPTRMAKHRTQWAVTNGQKFELKEIRHFKNLVGDSDWYSLLDAEPGFAIATEDFHFESLVKRPKKPEPVAEPTPVAEPPAPKLTKKQQAARDAELAAIEAAKADDESETVSDEWTDEAATDAVESGEAEGELVDAEGL